MIPTPTAKNALGSEPTRTRRQLLGSSVRILGLGFVLCPVAGSLLAGVSGCSDDAIECVDPELLSTPERALRVTQNYVNRSPHGEAKQCGACQFFRPKTAAGCGECQILAGPVSRTGHCDAWSQAKTS